MNSKLILIPCTALALIFSSISSYAGEKNWVATNNPAGRSGLRFSIAYTAGVHNGDVKSIQGLLVTDQDNNLSGAHVEVPIDAMATGDLSRDCHMREALGIDYTASRFPNEHVCDRNNRTPDAGADAVVFSKIIFDFTGFQSAPSTDLALAQTVLVNGTLTIHGQTRAITALPLTVQKITNADGSSSLRVQGNFNLSLKNYQVIVKPFKFGPFEIGVSDTAKINIDMAFVDMQP